jgi:hypothetical protein
MNWRNSRQRLPILVAKAIGQLRCEAALTKFEFESAAGLGQSLQASARSPMFGKQPP